MPTSRLKWLIAAVVCLMAATGSTLAHRGHDVLSVVEIDPRAGTVQVTHHFAAHDVEPALQQIAPEASPSLDDPFALDVLVAYVARRFVIGGAQGTVTLRHVDTQLAGDDVQLVYRGAWPASAREVSLQAGLFSALYPDKEHQVNVRRQGVTRTVRFRSGEAETRTVVFDEP